MADLSDASVQISRADETETSVTSIPVVFQCSQCSSIVGDSMSWVSANKILRSITLKNVTSRVGVKDVIEVSEGGVDVGSTFYTVYCIPCNLKLGRKYVASAADLDYIRGCFTFFVEKLNSYEVGSTDPASPQSDMADMMSIPSPKYMHTQINKIRYLMMSMNERLKSLETQVSVPVTSFHDDDQNNPQSTGHRGQGQVKGHHDAEDSESVTSSENASTKVMHSASSVAMTDAGNVELHDLHRYMIDKQKQTALRNPRNMKQRVIDNRNEDDGNDRRNVTPDKSLREKQPRNSRTYGTEIGKENEEILGKNVGRQYDNVQSDRTAEMQTYEDENDDIEEDSRHDNRLYRGSDREGLGNIVSPKVTRGVQGLVTPRGKYSNYHQEDVRVRSPAVVNQNSGGGDREHWSRGSNSTEQRVTKKRKIALPSDQC